MRLVSWPAGLMVMGLALVPRAALGQASDSNKAAAVALYDAAEKLMAAGSYAAACGKYAESNRLDPQLGALVHLADCYEKNGQLASAWASWRDAIEAAQRRGDAREQLARERAAALEPKLSRLTIEVPEGSDVPGLEIRRGGSPVARALWGTAMPVDAGEYEIEAAAPGKKKRVTKITVGGEAATEKYQLGALEDAPATAGKPASPPARDLSTGDNRSSAGSTQRTLGWVAGGLGVVGLGAGVLFELQRSSKASDRDGLCPNDKCADEAEKQKVSTLNEEVRSAATAETISFVAGGILLAGGAALLLTAPSDGPRASRRVLVAPSVARGQIGIAAIGSW